MLGTAQQRSATGGRPSTGGKLLISAARYAITPGAIRSSFRWLIASFDWLQSTVVRDGGMAFKKKHARIYAFGLEHESACGPDADRNSKSLASLMWRGHSIAPIYTCGLSITACSLSSGGRALVHDRSARLPVFTGGSMNCKVRGPRFQDD